MPADRVVRKPYSRDRRSPFTSGRPSVVDLPAEGCPLPCPKIPPGPAWTAAQRARWRQLWSSPQANMWDESVVGIVSSLISFESLILAGEASAWEAAEARQAGDSLGLSPKSMANLGWRIVKNGSEI
jgi:hypothetical protein